jgi:hypothetical protein
MLLFDLKKTRDLKKKFFSFFSKIFFAEEGTCLEHPATAAGTCLTGTSQSKQSACFTSQLRAVRVLPPARASQVREQAVCFLYFCSQARERSKQSACFVREQAVCLLYFCSKASSLTCASQVREQAVCLLYFCTSKASRLLASQVPHKASNLLALCASQVRSLLALLVQKPSKSDPAASRKAL